MSSQNNLTLDDDKKVVLAIFAHSDDELATAGTLANHSDAGDEVILVFLTKGENSTPVVGDANEILNKRKSHTDKIADLLGVQVRFLDFPDSRVEYTMDNAYKIAEVIREIRPKVLITWNTFERLGAGHPDHRNTAKLVFDAVNYARYKNPNSKYEPYRKTISYYRYWNQDFGHNKQIEYVDVTSQIEKINKFIEIYKEAYGEWPVEDFKMATLMMNGRMSGCKYAESFELVMKDNLAKKLLA